jgi:hypothetical protein
MGRIERAGCNISSFFHRYRFTGPGGLGRKLGGQRHSRCLWESFAGGSHARAYADSNARQRRLKVHSPAGAPFTPPRFDPADSPSSRSQWVSSDQSADSRLLQLLWGRNWDRDPEVGIDQWLNRRIATGSGSSHYRLCQPQFGLLGGAWVGGWFGSRPPCGGCAD